MADFLLKWFVLPALPVGAAAIVSSARPEEAGPRRIERLEWGIYQILWSRSYGEILEREVTRFASKPDHVMFYRDLGRPFPKRPVKVINALGATPMVSLELWSWHGGRKGSYLPALASGEYDDFLRKWARDAREDGRRILLRFGFEFNGNWFTWSQDPKNFVAAWRRAREIFRREKADNVEWVWSPNVESCPDTRQNRIDLYYPGDEHVDWLSVDGYNFGDKHDKWHKWQTFDEVFGSILGDFSERCPDKPVIISEFGCAPGTGSQRERWIRDAHESLMQYPQVKAVIWFNYDKRREKEPNWRIDITPESLQAFNETFARPATQP